MMFSGPEAFLQCVAEPQILRLEHLPLGNLHAPRLDVVGDHAGHDFQEAAALLQQIGIVQRHVDRERAHDFAAQRDWHAKKGHVGVGFRLPLVEPVGEARLLEDLRNDRRLAGFHDVADDAFAILIAVLSLAVAGDARRRGHDQLAAVRRKEHDRAANQAEPVLQQLEDLGQHLPLSMLRGKEPRDFRKDPQDPLHAGRYASNAQGPSPS